ncbi:unnamed protein product [Medioppia subpectinata]|uniref:Uncharacterized protein n=1 Tax=Medioppia subpectinata TaxID=1979941 RepID=A0A7R9PX93_9ACAR|nr:unnamed protein product [Medioppia subpectinata]CAG2104561.1 unnamed protein product [Medioppia subpectinata]
MSLLITRFVSAVVLFALTLVVGTVPVLWYQSWLRRKRHHRIRDNEMTAETSLSDNFYVQIVTQMGGGILFFTVFVHMIPDVRNNFEIYLKSNHSVFNDNSDGNSGPKSIEDLSLPYLEIAICFGFFAIYLTEVLMHSLLDRRRISYRTGSVKECDERTPILNREHRRSRRSPSSHSADNDSIVIVIDHRSE